MLPKNHSYKHESVLQILAVNQEIKSHVSAGCIIYDVVLNPEEWNVIGDGRNEKLMQSYYFELAKGKMVRIDKHSLSIYNDVN